MSHMDYRSYVDGSISLPSTSVAGSGSSDSPVGVGAPSATGSDGVTTKKGDQVC